MTNLNKFHLDKVLSCIKNKCGLFPECVHYQNISRYLSYFSLSFFLSLSLSLSQKFYWIFYVSDNFSCFNCYDARITNTTSPTLTTTTSIATTSCHRCAATNSTSKCIYGTSLGGSYIHYISFVKKLFEIVAIITHGFIKKVQLLCQFSVSEHPETFLIHSLVDIEIKVKGKVLNWITL